MHRLLDGENGTPPLWWPVRNWDKISICNNCDISLIEIRRITSSYTHYNESIWTLMDKKRRLIEELNIISSDVKLVLNYLKEMKDKFIVRNIYIYDSMNDVKDDDKKKEMQSELLLNAKKYHFYEDLENDFTKCCKGKTDSVPNPFE